MTANQQINVEQLPDWFLPVLGWLQTQPVFMGLLILMVLDIGSGLCVAVYKKNLNSTISWRGMSRKILMLLLTGMAGVIEQFMPSIPFFNIVSLFYTITEALSIVENAAAIGVPLPQGLVATLVKMRSLQTMSIDQKNPSPPQSGNASSVNVNVTTVNPSTPEHKQLPTTTTDVTIN